MIFSNDQFCVRLLLPGKQMIEVRSRFMYGAVRSTNSMLLVYRPPGADFAAQPMCYMPGPRHSGAFCISCPSPTSMPKTRAPFLHMTRSSVAVSACTVLPPVSCARRSCPIVFHPCCDIMGMDTCAIRQDTCFVLPFSVATLKSKWRGFPADPPAAVVYPPTTQVLISFALGECVSWFAVIADP